MYPGKKLGPMQSASQDLRHFAVFRNGEGTSKCSNDVANIRAISAACNQQEYNNLARLSAKVET